MFGAKYPQTLASLRVVLEDIQKEEIVWHPYHDLRRSSRPVQPVGLFHGIISCHDIKESYMPNKVLQQFGYMQMVPQNTLKVVTAAKGTKPLNYVPRSSIGYRAYLWSGNVMYSIMLIIDWWFKCMIATKTTWVFIYTSKMLCSSIRTSVGLFRH